MEIVVVEIVREEGGAVFAGVVGTCIRPFPSDGLDEAFGLAIGLGAIGAGEEVVQAQLLAGGGEALGTVSGTPIGEDLLDEDAVSLVEGDGLMERGQDTGGLFIRKETGKSETGMVIDGDVERFGAGARVAVSSRSILTRLKTLSNQPE